ncbi:MAG: TolC family protein, partial [bacterium]
QEARALADKNNNELVSAQKSLEGAEWSYKKSFSTFLPQLSATAGMTENLTSTSTTGAKTYSYGLSATQYLFKATEGLYGIQSAYANLEQEKASLRSAQASVYYDLFSAYVNLYVAQENVKLLEQILSQRIENTRLIQLRYDSGREDKGNLMTTKADQAAAKHDLASAKRDLNLAKLKLEQLLDAKVDKVDEDFMVGEPAAVDFAGLLTASPSYLTAQKTLELKEISQKSSLSGFLPSVSLSGSYRRSGSDWGSTTTSGKSWSLNISYPLFPGGSNIAEKIIADLELDAARQDFAKNVKDLRYSLEQNYNSYVDAVEALSVANISLAASRERAKITEAKYLNGLTTYDEWYRLSNTSIQEQKSLLTYEKSALLAEALWHKTYGGYIK